MEISIPKAAFYLWVKTPINDIKFAQQLYRNYNATVLPGSYLARQVNGVNPGENFIRLALVPSLLECTEGMNRVQAQCKLLLQE